MPEPLAHSGGHLLVDHLRAVASIAGDFSRQFDATADNQRWAYMAGLWHDLGKYRLGFQRYLRQSDNPDAHIEGKVAGREKTHSAAGALWAVGKGCAWSGCETRVSHGPQARPVRRRGAQCQHRICGLCPGRSAIRAPAPRARPACAMNRNRGNKRFSASAADTEAADAASAGEDAWSMALCLWLLNPAVVFGQLSGKARQRHPAPAARWRRGLGCVGSGRTGPPPFGGSLGQCPLQIPHLLLAPTGVEHRARERHAVAPRQLCGGAAAALPRPAGGAPRGGHEATGAGAREGGGGEWPERLRDPDHPFPTKNHPTKRT